MRIARMALAGRRREAGFTLVELLITVTIIGVIALPLGNLLIEYFDSTTQTTARLNESHDEQLAAGYFAQDVASLGLRDQTTQALQTSVWVGSSSGAPYACGSSSPLVLFAWNQFVASGGSVSTTNVEVAYLVQAVGGERQLQRVYCAGPSGAAATVVLAHNIDSSSLPQVTCTPSPCAIPTSVRMTLSVRDPSDPASAASTVLTLSGQRRQT